MYISFRFSIWRGHVQVILVVSWNASALRCVAPVACQGPALQGGIQTVWVAVLAFRACSQLVRRDFGFESSFSWYKGRWINQMGRIKQCKSFCNFEWFANDHALLGLVMSCYNMLWMAKASEVNHWVTKRQVVMIHDQVFLSFCRMMYPPLK